MKKIIKSLIPLLLLFTTQSAFAQEALKSLEEDYYDFLSLTGVVERPTLGYHTLSDSVWTFNEIETFEENEDGTFTKVRTPGSESDANIWNQKGIPSVVLGTGMTKVHTTEETLKVRDLEDTARLALALLTLE